MSVRAFLLTRCQFECSAGMYREHLEPQTLLDTQPSVELEATFEFDCFSQRDVSSSVPLQRYVSSSVPLQRFVSSSVPQERIENI